MSDQLAVLADVVGSSTKDSESERGEKMTNWGGGARGERVALRGKEGDEVSWVPVKDPYIVLVSAERVARGSWPCDKGWAPSSSPRSDVGARFT